MKRMKAFTLAEVIIVLTVLGIVAMLTVPSLIKHQTEVADRTKLKKIWKMYDQVIQTMSIENDIRGEDALKEFAEADNCGNCRKYFRASEYAEDGHYCVFKTHDGVWMNISDILHPTVTLDKDNNKTDNNTFTMVTRYDDSIRAFRTNDANYSGLTNDEKASLKNFFSKMDIEVQVEQTRSAQEGFEAYLNGEISIHEWINENYPDAEIQYDYSCDQLSVNKNIFDFFDYSLMSPAYAALEYGDCRLVVYGKQNDGTKVRVVELGCLHDYSYCNLYSYNEKDADGNYSIEHNCYGWWSEEDCHNWGMNFS